MKGIAVFLALLFACATLSFGQAARTAPTNKTTQVTQPTDCLQSANAQQETFEVKGVASDDKGPLAKLTVIAFPYLLPDNRPVTRFWLQDVVVVKDAGRGREFVYRIKGNEGALVMNNPHVLSDEVGAFTLQVPKGLFMVPCNCKGCGKYKAGELAIGVFTETSAGKWYTTRELIPVKIDLATASNDVGALEFKAAGPD